MLRTLPVLQVTWLPRSCAAKTTQLLSTTSPWASWLTSACSASAPTLESQGKRSGTTSSRSRCRSRRARCPEGGPSRLQTLLIRWFNESLRIDLETMALQRLKIILGSGTSHGKTFMIRGWGLHSSRQWKTISTRRTSMRSGKTSTIPSSKKIRQTWEEIQSKRCLTVIIMITNSQHLPRTKLKSIPVLKTKMAEGVSEIHRARSSPTYWTTQSCCYNSSTIRYPSISSNRSAPSPLCTSALTSIACKGSPAVTSTLRQPWTTQRVWPNSPTRGRCPARCRRSRSKWCSSCNLQTICPCSSNSKLRGLSAIPSRCSSSSKCRWDRPTLKELSRSPTAAPASAKTPRYKEAPFNHSPSSTLPIRPTTLRIYQLPRTVPTCKPLEPPMPRCPPSRTS